MKSFFIRLSHTGVTEALGPSFAKRIILTNLLGMLFAINMSVSAIVFFVFDYYWLGLFTAGFVLTEILWPVLNHFRLYNISRLGMLISSNLLGLAVSVSLPNTGYNNGFFVMAGLPILLFDLTEKKSLLLGLVLPLVLYPFSEWYQFEMAIRLTESTASIIHYSIGSIYVLLIFLMFYFLSRENKIAEEKIKQSAQKVAEAYQELADQRARTFSSSKFAALGEMAGGIAHEVNNPMTVINLNAEQLRFILSQEDIDREAASKSAEVISRTVGRVTKIIRSLKHFSRDATRDEVEKEPFRKIIDETLTFCSERFKNHGISLDIVMPEENVTITCNSIQISQVILNLLNNSFDAVETLEDKWVEIQVQKNKDKVIIAVTDSGGGIPEELREKIFLPFYTTKPVGKGTGLGLSLSKKIIQDHSGILSIDPGNKNTRFLIELPA